MPSGREFNRRSANSSGKVVEHVIRAVIGRFHRARIWHILVFVAIAVYIGATVRRARNYVSLIGAVVLILLGTIGRSIRLLMRQEAIEVNIA